MLRRLVPAGLVVAAAVAVVLVLALSNDAPEGEPTEPTVATKGRLSPEECRLMLRVTKLTGITTEARSNELGAAEQVARCFRRVGQPLERCSRPIRGDIESHAPDQLHLLMPTQSGTRPCIFFN